MKKSVYPLPIKGDAERKREMKRQANSHIKVGDIVFDPIYRRSVVLKINKKTFTVTAERGFTTTVDKSWVRKVKGEMK